MSFFNPTMPGNIQGGQTGETARPQPRFGGRSPLRQQMLAQAQNMMQGVQNTPITAMATAAATMAPQMMPQMMPSAQNMANIADIANMFGEMTNNNQGNNILDTVKNAAQGVNVLEKLDQTGILDTVAERGLSVISGEQSLNAALTKGITEIAEKNGVEDIGYGINKAKNAFMEGNIDGMFSAMSSVGDKISKSSNAKTKILGHLARFAATAGQKAST